MTLEVWARRVCAVRKAVLTGRQGTLQASGFDLAVGVDFFDTALELAPGGFESGLNRRTNAVHELFPNFTKTFL